MLETDIFLQNPNNPIVKQRFKLLKELKFTYFTAHDKKKGERKLYIFNVITTIPPLSKMQQKRDYCDDNEDKKEL